jgi:hypothetical protein
MGRKLLKKECTVLKWLGRNEPRARFQDTSTSEASAVRLPHIFCAFHSGGSLFGAARDGAGLVGQFAPLVAERVLQRATHA